MKAPLRLLWSEGMFMTPQHLQGLDRYHEALLAARLDAVSPHAWGVLAVEVDAAALAAGQFHLQRFSGILPEGLPVSFEPGDTASPPPRPVAEHFPPTARSLDAFLAVAREREGVPSYAEEGAAGASSRFAVATRSMQDATTPGASVPVSFARPAAVILFGDESRDDHEVIKVAEIQRAASGQLAVAESYVPPCLRVGASPWLLAGLKGLLARAVAKQRELSAAQAQRGAGAVEVTAADLSRILQLNALNGAIPLLALAADAPETAPLSAYLLLAQLAGTFSTFVEGADPSTLPRFSHTDLRSTFEGLFTRLGALLGGVAAEAYLAVALESRGVGFHVARLQDDRLLRGALLVLAVRSDLPEQQVVEQLPRLCKVASATDIQALVQAAAPGLPLQVVHRPPPGIPVRPGTVYFTLATGDRYWQGIQTERTLAIYLPPPFDPSRTKLELLALPAAGTGRGP